MTLALLREFTSAFFPRRSPENVPEAWRIKAHQYTFIEVIIDSCIAKLSLGPLCGPLSSDYLLVDGDTYNVKVACNFSEDRKFCVVQTESLSDDLPLYLLLALGRSSTKPLVIPE
ncbi:hypothetical protein [Xanthomonas perforans]|uniref:hypothetical protein n=1 Tax=Xanthomonas perforans TaxID=442694 RepID=UPI001F3BB0BB|nr:hypothetical protein [Xanthomonas perforans]MCF6004652.1 hypothetical protein [Xanthomonas perforans]